MSPRTESVASSWAGRPIAALVPAPTSRSRSERSAAARTTVRKRAASLSAKIAPQVNVGTLRVATVSTVALTTVGALLGNGGLGNLIYSGLRTSFQAEVLTATVLVVALAVTADVLLLGVQRAVTPWQRGVR